MFAADIYDEFVEKTVELAKKRTVGDPFAGKYDQGPQVLGCCSECKCKRQLGLFMHARRHRRLQPVATSSLCVFGMQVDAEQFDKIMSYISAGKEAGATLKHGAH